MIDITSIFVGAFTIGVIWLWLTVLCSYIYATKKED